MRDNLRFENFSKITCFLKRRSKSFITSLAAKYEDESLLYGNFPEKENRDVVFITYVPSCEKEGIPYSDFFIVDSYVTSHVTGEPRFKIDLTDWGEARGSQEFLVKLVKELERKTGSKQLDICLKNKILSPESEGEKGVK